VGAFDDLLSEHVTDPADRRAIADLANKYPGLEQAVLGYTEAEQKLVEWEAWRERSWDSGSKMTKGQIEALERLELAEQKLAESDTRKERAVEQRVKESTENRSPHDRQIKLPRLSRAQQIILWGTLSVMALAILYPAPELYWWSGDGWVKTNRSSGQDNRYRRMPLVDYESFGDTRPDYTRAGAECVVTGLIGGGLIWAIRQRKT